MLSPKDKKYAARLIAMQMAAHVKGDTTSTDKILTLIEINLDLSNIIKNIHE